jgi:hypothetical protein
MLLAHTEVAVNGVELLRLMQAAPDYDLHPLQATMAYESNLIRYVIQSLHISNIDMEDPAVVAPAIARLMSRFDDIIGRKILTSLESDIPDLARTIADYLLNAIAPDVAENLRNIPVGTVRNDTNILLAETIVAPSGDLIITVGGNLFKLIDYVAESSAVTNRITDPKVRDALIQEQLEELQMHLTSEISPGWSWERPGLSSDEFAHTSRIMFAAKCFVLAHEYAHCYLRHYHNSIMATIDAPNPLPMEKLDVLGHGDLEEFLADALAWTWLSEIGEKLPVVVDKSYIVRGIATLFHIFVLAEYYAPSKLVHTTHPISLVRLRTLLDAAIEPGNPPHTIVARGIYATYQRFTSL